MPRLYSRSVAQPVNGRPLSVLEEELVLGSLTDEVEVTFVALLVYAGRRDELGQVARDEGCLVRVLALVAWR